MLRRTCFGLSCAVILSNPASMLCQEAGANPVRPVGAIRIRAESMNWFGNAPGSQYSFLGATARFGLEQRTSRFEWRVEFAAPLLLGLPDDAVLPAPQGLLGHGANYYLANGRATQAIGLFPKQVYLRVKSADQRWQGRLGRFETAEGAETAPRSGALATVKRTRLAQRLIGPFGFTHIGRSFDGADLHYGRGHTQVTALAAVPTAGVFDMDGWGRVPQIVLGYAAVTTAGPLGADNGEVRIFGLYYRDGREVARTDNRPLAVRQGDLEPVSVGTIGGHYLQAVLTGIGRFDLTAWGALQFGQWGQQDHRAAAGTIELGWQPAMLETIRPWLRAGYFRSSGDRDAADATHQTFFQVLPTPRVYARFPFYNLMNLEDASVSLLLRPGTRTTLRADLRGLKLAEPADGWYIGGGAFDRDGFGYASRPSNGSRALATLLDLSADVQINRRWTVAGYASHALAGQVIRSIYPSRANGRYGYLELEYRW